MVRLKYSAGKNYNKNPTEQKKIKKKLIEE